MHDAIIVGGSYAGLSAALMLARARRRVLILDEGLRRNRAAAHAHGFLGQDGRDPAEVAAKGRAEVAAYPNAAFAATRAEGAERSRGGFAVTDGTGARHEGRRLILAVGVTDRLPEVPGLAERWGTRVFHCPYCHGYELGGGPIGVLASSDLSMHQALMLPDWGPVTFLLNGAFEPDEDERARLEARGVAVERERVARVTDAGVTLEDGREVALDGLFTVTRTEVASPLAESLGCAMVDEPLGRFIATDDQKATTVPGVYACGDAGRAAGSLTLAVGDGATAGVAAHQSLIFG